jgi:predicted nucleotidyltransferase
MTDTEAIQVAVQRILEVERPKSIYLFGSQARGDQSAGSDIDLLIEDDTELSMSERYSRYRRLLRGMKRPFDLLIFSSQEIAEKQRDKYSVVRKALEEGIKLYG